MDSKQEIPERSKYLPELFSIFFESFTVYKNVWYALNLRI